MIRKPVDAIVLLNEYNPYLILTQIMS